MKQVVSNENCAQQVFDEKTNTTGTRMSSYLTVATSIMCLKTQDENGYCLYEQLPTLLPVLDTLKSATDVLKVLVTNNKVVCNDCIQRELAVLKPLELTDFPSDIKNYINTFNDNYRLICLFGTSTITAEKFDFVPFTTTTAAPTPTGSLADPDSLTYSKSGQAGVMYSRFALFGVIVLSI